MRFIYIFCAFPAPFSACFWVLFSCFFSPPPLYLLCAFLAFLLLFLLLCFFLYILCIFSYAILCLFESFLNAFFVFLFFTFSVFLFEHFLHLFRLLYIYVLVVFFSFAFVAFFRSRFLCAPFFHKIIVCLCTSTSSTDHYRANRSFHFFPLWACPNEMFTQP